MWSLLSPQAFERRGFRLVTAAVLAATSGCYSFSSYQSPRLLEPGEVAVTPSVTRFQFTGDDAEWEHGDWAVEVQASAGVAERGEVGVKLARIFLENGYQFIGFEPRFALVTNHVALGLLLGTFFGESVEPDLQLILHSYSAARWTQVAWSSSPPPRRSSSSPIPRSRRLRP
jgi:hypothetical protein